MRNPFKRKRRLSGASAEWNKDEHVDWGDDHVAIPSDQLPPDAEGQPGMTMEAMERLAGISIANVDGTDCVVVNATAAQAEVERWAENYLKGGAEPSDAEMEAATVAAFNNPAHWKKSGDEIDPDDDVTEYMFMRIDLTTGRIGANA